MGTKYFNAFHKVVEIDVKNITTNSLIFGGNVSIDNTRSRAVWFKDLTNTNDFGLILVEIDDDGNTLELDFETSRELGGFEVISKTDTDLIVVIPARQDYNLKIVQNGSDVIPDFTAIALGQPYTDSPILTAKFLRQGS